MIMSPAARVGILLGLTALTAVPAHAQSYIDSREGIALQNQILELRREIENMPHGGGYAAPVAPPPSRGGGGGGDLVPQLLSRVDALEEEVRQLRGQVDQISNAQQQQGADLSKQIGDLGFRVQNLEQGRPGAAPPAVAPSPPPPAGATLPLLPPATAGAPPAAAPPRTPERALQEGNAALARRDYAAAQADAQSVLTGYRTSPRAYDAQYLMAQSLSGQRQYSQAAIAYDDAYNRSPKGIHAPDALLGLAGALADINERQAACETLNKFHTEFPTARADQREAAAAARQRAGCR